MAVPTISSVSPATGHSGGQTLLEIVGTGFALPAAPAATGPVAVAPPSVTVTVGGRAATGVAVVSATTIYCLTPKGDPVQITRGFTASATTNLLTSAAHGLKAGQSVRPYVSSDAGELPAPLIAHREYFVVSPLTNTLQLALTPGGAAIDLTTDGTGTLALDAWTPVNVTVQNNGSTGVPVSGELATATAAFAFARPDLAEESELARAMRALIRELKRQVHPNVSLSTHTDYDSTTGDTLNLALVESVPALILGNLEIPEDRIHHVPARTEVDVGTGRFVERRPAVAVDLQGTLIGVANNQIELLNLMHALRMFFKKTPYLDVDRSASDSSLGAVQYELDWSFGGPVSVSHQGDNTNVESFGGSVVVRGVLLEDMPGISNDRPASMPSTAPPHESTTRWGYKAADDATAVTVDAGPKPED